LDHHTNFNFDVTHFDSITMSAFRSPKFALRLALLKDLNTLLMESL